MARLIPPPPQPMAGTLARDAFGREIGGPAGAGVPPSGTDGPLAGGSGAAAPAKEKASDAIGRRAAALAEAIDFPTFVASLVHGTYDAIVDSSIRQVESFADLVSAVAKPVEQFAQENVTEGQARGWLVEQHPRDVTLVEDSGGYRLAPLVSADEDAAAPAWLAEYGGGGEFTSEALEETVLPNVRRRIAEHRLSTLSTMVLLGMQRVVVKDGTIAASLNFQAKARDRAAVQYATSNDPGTGPTSWGGRASGGDVVTTVSTVAVNAQSDTDLKATLTGKVSINFASETLPLDRFVDEASRTLLERHSRPGARVAPAPAAPAASVPAAQPVVAAAPPAPVVPAPAAVTAPGVPA